MGKTSDETIKYYTVTGAGTTKRPGRARKPRFRYRQGFLRGSTGESWVARRGGFVGGVGVGVGESVHHLFDRIERAQGREDDAVSTRTQDVVVEDVAEEAGDVLLQHYADQAACRGEHEVGETEHADGEEQLGDLDGGRQDESDGRGAEESSSHVQPLD